MTDRCHWNPSQFCEVFKEASNTGILQVWYLLIDMHSGFEKQLGTKKKKKKKKLQLLIEKGVKGPPILIHTLSQAFGQVLAHVRNIFNE
jgi:hypothetical protein